MMSQTLRRFAAAGCLVGATGMSLALTRAPTPPLDERVEKAEQVFVGTLVNRVEDGDWVQAELRVDIHLRGDKKGALVPVIWRKRLGDLQIYDAPENARGIAILSDKHEGRYWLRADKFEPVQNLQAVRRTLALAEKPQSADRVPTLAEWVQAGKPLPEGMMFTGGTPWFDERTGTKRSPEEVYGIIYGKPTVSPRDKPVINTPVPPKSRFPAHWGEPPKLQTRDLRPLPGGYGRGSGTLAKWIKENMARMPCFKLICNRFPVK